MSLLKDINPAGSSNPASLIAVDDLLYFVADDGIHGRELWRSDGTTDGTVLVADIKPGAAGSDPSPLASAGGVLYFSARDGTHGRELWRSDGTPAGTRLVKNISAGSTYIEMSASVGSRLFFVAKTKLWVSDGTSAGTFPLAAASVRQMVELNGKLYYATVDSPPFGPNMWRSDGTVGGTKAVGWSPTDVHELAATNDLLFMLRENEFVGPLLPHLWKSDGTKAGTLRLTSKYELEDPSSLTAAGSRVFFVSGYGGGWSAVELWKSNGTVTGTKLVKDLGERTISQLVAVDSNVFMVVANEEQTSWELWRSRGKARNTRMLVDLATLWQPAELTAVGSDLCFYSVDYGTDTWTMWESDGTVAGTYPATSGAGADTHPNNLAAAGSKLFFSMDNGVSGAELWSYVP